MQVDCSIKQKTMRVTLETKNINQPTRIAANCTQTARTMNMHIYVCINVYSFKTKNKERMHTAAN